MFTWEISKQMLGAIIRWILISISGWLVAKNIVPQELFDAWLPEAVSIIVGVLILLVTIGWKFLNARFNILSLIKAVQTEPPADTAKEIKAAVIDAQAAAQADPKLTIPV